MSQWPGSVGPGLFFRALFWRGVTWRGVCVGLGLAWLCLAWRGSARLGVVRFRFNSAWRVECGLVVAWLPSTTVKQQKHGQTTKTLSNHKKHGLKTKTKREKGKEKGEQRKNPQVRCLSRQLFCETHFELCRGICMRYITLAVCFTLPCSCGVRNTRCTPPKEARNAFAWQALQRDVWRSNTK